MFRDRPSHENRRFWLAILPLVFACAAISGCTPWHYRLAADRETYGILAEKANHPLWCVPPKSIEPPPDSRNSDPYDPDCSPMPPDDPAAQLYMQCVDGKSGYRGWHARGDAPNVEPPDWLAYLPFTDRGELELNQDRAVELGLLNSREYQFELERVYLVALGLTLERFEYDLQWSLGNSTFHEFLGDRISGRLPRRHSKTLTTNTELGFTRNFATGGQLLVDFANTFVWEFSGDHSDATLSVITVNLVQPLLRGAYREVRLEGLTQAERNVLYAVRDYARFRKQFYFDLVSGDGGYLSLLLQVQAIRNLEANVASLKENLRAHEALVQAGVVDPIQFDQVFQSYQSGQLQLIRAQNALQTALDAYKIRLGLPPEIEVRLNDELLKPFELNSAEVGQLQDQVEVLLAEFRALDEVPSRERLEAGFRTLQSLHASAVEQVKLTANELERWRPEEPRAATGNEQRKREWTARYNLQSRLGELAVDVWKLGEETGRAASTASAQPENGWQTLQRLARHLSSIVGDAFILQTQIRAYLVQLGPADWRRDEAIRYGLNNRLDLMNRRAEVVDAWRQIYVAADALEADLDVFADGNLATEVGGNNPLKFSSRDSRYRIGVRFDGPLNRMAERNIYRAELIDYERARRRLIASRDAVVQAIRLDLRQLAADRLNFDIARESLIVAARQVELARIMLVAPGPAGDSSTTQNVLDALNRLLEAKNALIAIWVAYETDRLRLQLDTEALQLDERGLARDDNLDSIPESLEVVPPIAVDGSDGGGVDR